jgi:hypothetical protein
MSSSTACRLVALSVVIACVWVRTAGQKPPDAKIVLFCDMAADPVKFDGQLVKTQAQYSGSDHGALLTSSSCPSPSGSKKYANPRWGSSFDSSSRNAKILTTLLRKHETADVTVTGVVHAKAGVWYGIYDAPFEIDLQKIDEIKRDPNP